MWRASRHFPSSISLQSLQLTDPHNPNLEFGVQLKWRAVLELSRPTVLS